MQTFECKHIIAEHAFVDVYSTEEMKMPSQLAIMLWLLSNIALQRIYALCKKCATPYILNNTKDLTSDEQPSTSGIQFVKPIRQMV